MLSCSFCGNTVELIRWLIAALATAECWPLCDVLGFFEWPFVILLVGHSYKVCREMGVLWVTHRLD
jgi:hypothetical protein